MDWQTALHEILYAIIVFILPLVVRYVVVFLSAKTKEIAGKTENETLRKYVQDANEIIASIVLSVSQTYVDSMKKAGKFTPEAQETAKNMAVSRAKELISEASRNAITVLYNDFDAYINAQIEALVRETKLTVDVPA